MANFNDTLVYTFIVTLFGMGIVFIVLILLQYILKTMKVVFYKENGQSAKSEQVRETKAVETAAPQVNYAAAVEENEDELVAAITAALMSCLGGRSNIVVRNIRRVDDFTPAWGKVSRTEQMGNRF